ncbi:MAG: hypothetical protein O7G87_14750, partial [bacterium]|nr:hypothetical protein [bacterium]
HIILLPKHKGSSMLTRRQTQTFYDEGFLKLEGVIPKLMVDAARKAINHRMGQLSAGELDLEGDRRLN